MADFDYSRYTPADNTDELRDVFKSGYKNVRFSVQPNTQFVLTATTMANLPGLAYQLYGDTSLWRTLLAYNGYDDALSDMCVGLKLSIPTKADIMAFASAQQNNDNPQLTL